MRYITSILTLVLALACAAPARAQAVDLEGLTGTWIDENRRNVEVEQTAQQITLKLHDGRLFEGSIDGTRIRLQRDFPPELVPVVAPDIVRDKLLADVLAFEGTLSVDEGIIEGAFLFPAYNRSGARLAPRRESVVFTRKSGDRHCPNIIRDGVLRDRSRGIACPQSIPPPATLAETDARSTAQLFERYLQQHPDFLVERPPVRRVATSCSELPDVPRSEKDNIQLRITTEYYWSRARITEGILSALESIAALERVEDMSCGLTNTGRSLSVRLLRNQECSAYARIPGGEAACQHLKNSCAGAVNLTSLVDQTEIAQRKVEMLDTSQRAVDAERIVLLAAIADGGLANLQRLALLGTESKKIDAQRQALIGAVPWVGGKEFKEGYEDALEACQATPSAGAGFCEGQRPRLVCQGVTREAANQRAAVQRRLARYMEAERCLTDNEHCTLSLDDFRATVNASPAMQDVRALSPFSPEDRSRARFAAAQLTTASCRSDVRVATDEADQLMQDFFVSSALTIATAGLSSAASGVRAAALAAKTVEAASAGLRTARVLQVTGVLLDVADIGRSALNTINSCNASHSLGTHNYRRRSDGPACPSGDAALGNPVAESYTKCIVTGLAVDLAFGVLPALPAGVSAALDRSTLRAAADAMGVELRTLSAQKQGLILQLFRNGIGHLDDAGIEQLIKQMKDAGFNEAAISKMLARFVPDLQLVGGQLLRGLEGGKVLRHADINIAGAAHKLTVRNGAGGPSLWLCTTCGSVLGKIDDLLESQGITRETRDRLLAIRARIEALESRLPRLSEAEMGRALDTLAGDLRTMTNDTGSRLALSAIARNTNLGLAERTTQNQLRERMRGFNMFDQTPDSDLHLEPFFKDGELVAWVRRDGKLVDIADDLGIPHGPMYAAEFTGLPANQRAAAAAAERSRVQALVAEQLRDSTAPDFLVMEMRNGVLTSVALEVKTPRSGSVFEFFKNDLSPRKTRIGVWEDGEGMLSQAERRRRQLPTGMPSELVIDLRNLPQRPEDAMRDLAAVIELPQYREYHKQYSRVRFVIGGPGDGVLTESVKFPGAP